jgi:methylamine---glutamate N-methyltransferase subunit C
MSGLRAPGFPEEAIRARAATGAAAAFPEADGYGSTLYGASVRARSGGDVLDELRIVPPVFMPSRLEKLVELGREPLHPDVALGTEIGGFASALPVMIAAFGSTDALDDARGEALARQAGRVGIPMVIGENVAPVIGFGRRGDAARSLLRRVEAYVEETPEGMGGIAVQQSTEDADAEVWNLLYSDPAAAPLLASGRLAFELKVGQGAKPGLGGMTLLREDAARRLDAQYAIEPMHAPDGERHLRCSSPGTFTEEILRRQLALMRNNFPQCRIWVKLPPGRDIRAAAHAAWEAGADSVTVDGAEGGSGWAPRAFLEHVGLPLGECLLRIGAHRSCLCASGRIWEGTRALKCLALGASAVGLGRASLIAVDEDPQAGLTRLLECLALELRLLTSALGKYRVADLDSADVWLPGVEDAWPPVHDDELETPLPLRAHG